MAQNLNSVTLVGNLTRDPELRHTPSGTAVATMRIAVNDRVKRSGEWEDAAYYFDITVWAGLAENCAQYLSKGKKVGIVGKLTWREFEHNGNQQQRVEITAFTVEFLSPRDDSGSSSFSAPASAGSGDFPAADADSDIPF